MKLSICIPCGGAPVYRFPLERTLALYALQTSLDFEVILAFDGGEHPVADQPYPLKTTRVVRTMPDTAHRNHARNAAAALASGEYLFFPDSDCIPELHLVEHLIAGMDSHPGHALAPVMWGTGMPPPPQNDWWSCPHDARVLDMFKRQDNVWPLTGHRAVSSRYPVIEQTPKQPISEGYPCVDRRMWRALEGFDEAYLGWGRNKEEFVLRLNQIVPYRLLRSAAVLTQPHAKQKQKVPGRVAEARFAGLSDSVHVWGPLLKRRYESLSP